MSRTAYLSSFLAASALVTLACGLNTAATSTSPGAARASSGGAAGEGRGDLFGSGGAFPEPGGGASGGGAGGTGGEGGVPSGLCGNGTIDLGEECDDANDGDLDGCDHACVVECPADRREVPRGVEFFKSHDHHCYAFSHHEAVSWAAAAKWCTSFQNPPPNGVGAGENIFYLAALSTIAEIAEVTAGFGASTLFMGASPRVWIGAARSRSALVDPLTFVWVNCEPWGADYTTAHTYPWAANEPDSNDQDCVSFANDDAASRKPVLHDEACGNDGAADTTFFFLCERWPAGSSPTEGACDVRAP